ncbi:MAG TPA: tetratricopeptide repeat protein [Candidatus Bathyarchaeia archaeon]|nr:tetratricopeptide repeat protein [Candidatus Bathyarchaeia archaeon]
MNLPRALVVPVLALALGAAAASAQEPPAQEPPAQAPAPTPPPQPGAAPPPAALADAKEAFRKGSCPEALDAALKVLAEQPKNLEGLYIAGACERQLNQLDAAKTHLETLLETSPIFPLVHFQLGYVGFLRADALAREGKAEDAKATYGAAADEFGKELERNATHAASLSSRAIALGRAGRTEESITAHEAWIAAAAQKNDPVISLAATLAGAGKSTDAMTALDRLPDKSTKAAFDATMAVASVYTARRDFGSAVPFLEKAAQIDAASTRVRSELVVACARAGQIDDAVRNLKALLAMEPTPDEAEAAGEAIKLTVGDGRSAPSRPGLEPPAVLRIPTPRYPKGQDMTVQTEVLVLVQVKRDNMVGDAVMVPNRIWKDMRTTGFEQEAIDAAKRGKFVAGTKDGNGADLWIVAPVRFARP